MPKGERLENWILVCFHSFLVIKSSPYSMVSSSFRLKFLVYVHRFYTINTVIQDIISIIELLFFIVFYIDKITTLK